MTPAEFDALPESEARAALARCCGASRWVEAMLASRPFGSAEAVQRASDRAWAGCGPVDFKEAFTHHPPIGDLDRLASRFADTREWASGEQSGVAGAPPQLLERLAEGNRRYEARFGHLFIVCATGLSAAEMLDRLESRLTNEPEAELRIAAGEQHRITRLRLEKLLA